MMESSVSPALSSMLVLSFFFSLLFSVSGSSSSFFFFSVSLLFPCLPTYLHHSCSFHSPLKESAASTLMRGPGKMHAPILFYTSCRHTLGPAVFIYWLSTSAKHLRLGHWDFRSKFSQIHPKKLQPESLWPDRPSTNQEKGAELQPGLFIDQKACRECMSSF